MKRLTVLYALFCSAVFFSACYFNRTTGSGNIISEKRTVSDFSEIAVSTSIDVEVKPGATTEVIVEADDNIIKYVETDVSGDKLKIKTKSLHSFSDAHIKVYVTIPVIRRIDASASADVKIVGILKTNESLVFEASSSATIKGYLEASKVEANTSSAGNIKLTGVIQDLDADASSGSGIDAMNLIAENVTVSVSSGASAKVYANKHLDASASSGGHIVYDGTPTIKQSVSSGGSVDSR